ncbi:YlbD family protein [Niallia sp. 03190]|uniref:YlbD family protein n=1 Tax=Niallia sp. 03190 TaxID=3458061 RepID=UPI004044E08B
MEKKKIHPSVEAFKTFVKGNPKIIQEVRSGKATWQELYEDWYLLGEEDARWDNFRDSKTSTDQPTDADNSNKTMSMSSVMDSLKNMDQNQLQGYIANLSQALGTIQGVISQLAPGSAASTNATKNSGQKQPTGPFSFRKD